MGLALIRLDKATSKGNCKRNCMVQNKEKEKLEDSKRKKKHTEAIASFTLK